MFCNFSTASICFFFVFASTYVNVVHRSASLSPSHRYLSETMKLAEESKMMEENTYESSKKQYSSFLKFQISGTNDMHRRSPPSVPSPAPPSPPPRLNRLSSNGSISGHIPSSPLMMKRGFYDNPDSPILPRRGFIEGSPLLSRR